MSKLFIVPTPIGNLEDITLRAIKVLKEANLILCEDTRTSNFLLKHFEITTSTFGFHQHNEHTLTPQLVKRMKMGETMALISDAGTPGISDAAFLLVRECVKESVRVECLPGAVAFIPALVESGFPLNRFCFEGFLPHKKGRQTRLKALAEETRTIVFYESPNRLVKLMDELKEIMGTERQASVSRELTKVYAETVRGTLAELISHFTKTAPRGEIVFILAGKEE